MDRVPLNASAANDNEPWSDEAYFRLIGLSGKVLKAILKRLSGGRSIEAMEIAQIIRQVCNQATDPLALPCPGTLAIEGMALRLERDERCL